MKKSILFISSFLFTAAVFAQPTSYTIDSMSFNALSLEGGMTQVRFADVNQDGNLDMVTIGDHGSPNINANEHGITVFFGNGTGSNWTLFQNGNFGYGGCAVGDLNNDGKQDIAYSMHHNMGTAGSGGDKLIEAALGNGSGKSWTAWDAGLASNGESYGMFGTDLGDVNNDGLLDIGSNSFGLGPGVHIYKNLGTGNWKQTFTAGYGGTTGKFLQFGDMDGDGNIDFVVSNEVGSAYFGNGNGGFTLKQAGLPLLPDLNENPYGDVSLGDIDNDGDDDFIFTFDNSTTGIRGVYVYKWNKSAQSWTNVSSGLPNSTTDYFTAARLVDTDMDGYLDVVTSSYYNSDIQIWKGNGGSSWVNNFSIKIPGMGGVQDIAISDVDHSGYPDILVWGSFSDGSPYFPQSVNKIRLLRDVSVVHGISANLSYPKGNECWPNYAVRFITWTSGVMGNHSTSVKIEYSTTGNSGPWTVIAAAAPNNGSYQWGVPANVNSSTCFIRVTATDNVNGTTAVDMNAVAFNIGCNASTGVGEVAEGNSSVVFPNPMLQSSVIYSEMRNCDISIIDITGSIVKKIANVDNFPFSIERGNLSAGIYVLELYSESKIERIKVVVE